MSLKVKLVKLTLILSSYSNVSRCKIVVFSLDQQNHIQPCEILPPLNVNIYVFLVARLFAAGLRFIGSTCVMHQSK